MRSNFDQILNIDTCITFNNDFEAHADDFRILCLLKLRLMIILINNNNNNYNNNNCPS